MTPPKVGPLLERYRPLCIWYLLMLLFMNAAMLAFAVRKVASVTLLQVARLAVADSDGVCSRRLKASDTPRSASVLPNTPVTKSGTS